MRIEPEGITWETSSKGKDAEGRDWLLIPVAKASTKEDPSSVAVCIDQLPEAVYQEVIAIGLREIIKRGQAKIPGDKKDANRQAALEAAGRNVEALYAGKIRMTAGTKTKISGALKTESMRMARDLVRARLKAAGFKVSHYPAREITALATQVLEGEHGASIMAEARRSLEARAAKETEIAIDVSSLKPSPELVKKSQERAKKAKKEKPSAEAIAAATGKGKVEARATKH